MYSNIFCKSVKKTGIWVVQGYHGQAELIVFDLLGGLIARVYFGFLPFPPFKACIFC